MRKMETLLLLSPELSVEQRETILATMDGVVTREGGKMLAVDQWGMRDLAYPVRKQMRGFYVRLEYAAPSKLVAELERVLRITDGVFKYLTVRLSDNAEVTEETIIEERLYHTIKEVKNGEGPHPIKTPQGWLHLAHGVRNCAAGLRYVLYMYMTALDDPTRVIARPGGYFMAPEGEEHVGDVSNVLFANGWIADPDGKVFIYYASSDTRLHVATSTIERLVDYCMNTPEDGLTTSQSVETLKALIDKNKETMKTL